MNLKKKHSTTSDAAYGHQSSGQSFPNNAEVPVWVIIENNLGETQTHWPYLNLLRISEEGFRNVFLQCFSTALGLYNN